MAIEFMHVDVFSARPYGGNSLAVFPDSSGLSGAQMLKITQELRHFETVFFEPAGNACVCRTRVFDLFKELPFAGHPLIGGGAVMHHQAGLKEPQTWKFELASKTVTVDIDRTESGFYGLMDQGTPALSPPLERLALFSEPFGLSQAELHPDLPPQVVSTGLQYLVVPVIQGALGRARIRHDITSMLSGIGAQFAVLFEEAGLKIRHWNNDGIVEDIATGSAAGTIGAYRLRHGLTRSGEAFMLHQGQYAGRPSTLRVQAEGSADAIHTVKVGGDVAFVGRGILDALP